MESIVDTLAFTTLLIAVASWVMILIMRAIVATKFLSKSEFESFQGNGISRSISSFPARGLSWEYKFIRAKLAESELPGASSYSIVWRISFLALCLSGVLFVAVPVLLAFW